MQRSWHVFLASLGVGLFFLISFSVGVWSAPAVRSLLGISAGAPAGETEIKTFWQAWSLVMQHYVDRQKIHPHQMEYGAIRGMLATLDDPYHTRFLTPKEFRQQEQSLQGRLIGIGVVLISRRGQIVIDEVYPQSPAAHAGLTLGDTILAVNDRSVQGMTITNVAQLIRGPQGTTVTVTIAPAGSTTTHTVTLRREPLHVASVRWAMVPGTPIADIAIHAFSMGTTSELHTVVRRAAAAGATAMLLDLRNDPGGLLDEAISAASTFLSSGTVLEERNAQGAVQRVTVEGAPLDTTAPLVVLVNHDTASAAEIFAAALRDNHRAIIIGTPTLGTGTVLSTFRLQDGSALLLGTQEWLTPRGTSLWLHGIKPNILVPLPKNDNPIFPATLAFPTRRSQLHTLSDPVLVRGLDVLEQAISK